MHLFLIYAGIFIGIFFEGEMVMITSVIAANHGHLNLGVVVAIGLAGNFASDSVYFFLGRSRGRALLNKSPRFQKNYAMVDRNLERYPILIFFTYRFIYGLRSVAPLVIGASKTKTSKFFILSTLSLLIWVVAYTTLGYLFGEVLKTKFSYIEHIEKYVIGGLLIVGLVIYVVYRVISKNSADSFSQNYKKP